jgi:hypothetical protein
VAVVQHPIKDGGGDDLITEHRPPLHDGPAGSTPADAAANHSPAA